MAFRFTTAIVRRVPDVFVKAIRMDGSTEVNLPLAKKQWTNYVDSLKLCGVNPVILEADEQFPDCTFVEDTAVVIGARALLTRLGHPSRRGEVDAMRKALKNLKNGPEIIEMNEADAQVDGGDVLFTGQEILVGESARTNARGIQCLQAAFPEYPVTAIPIRESLHLKTVATVCGDNQLVIGTDKEGKLVLEQIKSKAKFKYDFVEVDNKTATNVLRINDHVIMKSVEEMGLKSSNILKKSIKGETIDVPFSEFFKVDGCLTCCSVLINANSTT